MMIAIKFKQRWTNYQAGMIAGFPVNVADKLVRDGIAEVLQVDLPTPIEPTQDVPKRSIRDRLVKKNVRAN